MYIGDGAKLVRDAFELAKQKAPAIIFIDELDAIGTKRFDSDKAGDREVQRTMLELLNQLDGFSSDSRIKVGSSSLTDVGTELTSRLSQLRTELISSILHYFDLVDWIERLSSHYLTRVLERVFCRFTQGS
jgi:SpoVK/Ycf46/Vps4 family AAA+-type ATPase